MLLVNLSLDFFRENLTSQKLTISIDCSHGAKRAAGVGGGWCSFFPNRQVSSTTRDELVSATRAYDGMILVGGRSR